MLSWTCPQCEDVLYHTDIEQCYEHIITEHLQVYGNDEPAGMHDEDIQVNHLILTSDGSLVKKLKGNKKTNEN